MSDPAPPPPWHTRSKRATAKPPLTQAAIVDAALRVLDRDGVESLSMRSVADELATGAASIYRHISSRDELLELVLDRVLAGVRTQPPDPDRWREQVAELATQIHRTLSAHRDIARIAMSSRPVGPNSVRINEAFLAILRTAGFGPRLCVLAVSRLSLYVTADVFERALFTRRDPRFWREVAAYYRSLPADRFPHTSSMVDSLAAGAGDHFRGGLDLLLDGLASQRDREDG